MALHACTSCLTRLFDIAPRHPDPSYQVLSWFQSHGHDSRSSGSSLGPPELSRGSARWAVYVAAAATHPPRTSLPPRGSHCNVSTFAALKRLCELSRATVPAYGPPPRLSIHLVLSSPHTRMLKLRDSPFDPFSPSPSAVPSPPLLPLPSLHSTPKGPLGLCRCAAPAVTFPQPLRSAECTH
eukprot:GGOE01005264.1.p1 GENE.GGOE01005264.1~~GGOE01005264.1.p1  ORF type:complete len:182 (-),score=6.93 GGOE01005264.1:70-615(-)